MAGPLSVSEFCFRGLRFFHKQIPAKLPGSRFADSLIHRLSTHFPELTGAVAQRRERNAALCAIQKPGFFIFETLSSLSLTLDMSSCLVQYQMIDNDYNLPG